MGMKKNAAIGAAVGVGIVGSVVVLVATFGGGLPAVVAGWVAAIGSVGTGFAIGGGVVAVVGGSTYAGVKIGEAVETHSAERMIGARLPKTYSLSESQQAIQFVPRDDVSLSPTNSIRGILSQLDRQNPGSSGSYSINSLNNSQSLVSPLLGDTQSIEPISYHSLNRTSPVNIDSPDRSATGSFQPRTW